MLAGLLGSATQSACARHDTEPHTLKGIVERFNYSPKGSYESLLIKSGDTLVQVNFPPHMMAEVTQAVATGDQISVVAVAENSKGDHPVYRLEKLTTTKGADVIMRKPEPGEHPKPEEHLKPEKVEKVEGVVKYLNYARHGEVNGAVLESGDFIHLGPHGAELVKLASGQKLVIEGAAATMVDGHKAMDHPSKVNGVSF
jgi:hypothetical protein